LHVHPYEPKALFGYVMTLYRLGRYQEALFYAEKGCKLDGCFIYADMLALRGVCKHRLRMYSEAHFDMNAAIILKPDLKGHREIVSAMRACILHKKLVTTNSIKAPVHTKDMALAIIKADKAAKLLIEEEEQEKTKFASKLAAKQAKSARRKTCSQTVATITKNTICIPKYAPPMVTDKVPKYNIDTFTCPLSLEIFVDPVVAIDGYTYERKYIENWFVKHDSSPMTQATLQSKILIPNIIMRPILDCIRNQ